MQQLQVLLVVGTVFATHVLGQVATLCRPNERFLSCGGCQKTCRNPAPACAAVCREGCYCPEEQVRDDEGHCIPLSHCPSENVSHYETTDPHFPEHCPLNEEYKFCEPCNRTCDNPNPICPAQCGRGCYCKDDLVRDRDGRCVKQEHCKKHEVYNYVSQHDVSYMECGPNQVLKDCENCEKTCSNPNPICPAQCARGCFCTDGLYKSPDGRCVTLDNCPKAEMTLSGAHELTVEDCSPDEEYLSCGWCEPTCSEPHPRCPIGVCTRGCLCRLPLLRHYSGQCVEQNNCLPQKCINPNEEYVCRYGCEARCDRIGCSVRPRGCTLGCHCKFGLLRDVTTGLCITPDKCNKSFKLLLS